MAEALQSESHFNLERYLEHLGELKDDIEYAAIRKELWVHYTDPNTPVEEADLAHGLMIKMEDDYDVFHGQSMKTTLTEYYVNRLKVDLEGNTTPNSPETQEAKDKVAQIEGMYPEVKDLYEIGKL